MSGVPFFYIFLFVLFIPRAIPYIYIYIKITLFFYLQIPTDQNFMRRSSCLEMLGKEKSEALVFIYVTDSLAMEPKCSLLLAQKSVM
jgi:hypothetical protein